MKKLLLLPVVILSMMLTGCSDEDDGPDKNVIWDFVPITMYIDIVDDEGNSLIDPQNSDYITDQNIYIMYHGQRYDLINNWALKPIEPQSRTMAATWYGIKTDYTPSINDLPQQPRLLIGEWAGGTTYEMETVTLVWDNGRRTDELAMSNHLSWKKHQPVIDRRFFLNGVEQESKYITIHR